MTLIIGIICQDAIVMASDSQTTRDGRKRTDAEKLSILQFGPDRVLVGQAGNAGNSARAIEIVTALAKDKAIDDYRMPADLAREAMLQLKRDLKQQYCECTVEQLSAIIWKEDLQSELMLGYYHKGKPYLFTVDLAVGRSDKENSWYSAIGCGASLGSYLLCEHTHQSMNAGVAECLANYIVETVCKHDPYCSPPVRRAIIIHNIAAYATSLAPPVDSPHPTIYTGGMAMLSVTKHTQVLATRVERIIQKEKLSRNKKIASLLARHAALVKATVDDFMADPGPKHLPRMKRRLSGLKDMTKLEFFFEKDSPLGRAAKSIKPPAG